MKQVERVIKRGDYYEIEVIEDAFSNTKTSRKEESQISIPPPSENIQVELPSYRQARSNYFYHNQPSYDTADPNQLLHELQDILNAEKLADEDKQEILKLMREVRQLKEQALVPLTDLSLQKVKEQEQAKLSSVQLKMKMDLSDLQKRIGMLEGFSYPEISKLEHQLQVLLGEKKLTPSVPASKQDRNKEEIQSLFAQFSGLKSANNLPPIIDKIHASNSKYVEMEDWANKVQDIISFHSDFLAQLKEDEALLEKLSSNFKKNVSTVRQILAKLSEVNKR